MKRLLMLSALLCSCSPKAVANEASLLPTLKPEQVCSRPSLKVDPEQLPSRRMVGNASDPDSALPKFRRLEGLGLVSITPGKVGSFDILTVALTPLGVAQIGEGKSLRACGIFTPTTLSNIVEKGDEASATASGPLDYGGWASRPDYRQALLDRQLPATYTREYGFTRSASGWAVVPDSQN